MTSITSQRLFDAPADIVWAVMTDLGVYAAVAPNLSSAVVLHGEGEGMIRKCVDTKGNAWTELCNYWEAGQGSAVAVDVETSEFHRSFFTRFEGRWELTERDDGVLVTMAFDFDTKYGPFGALLERYFQYKAIPLIEDIFDGWSAEIETRLAKSERPDESMALSEPETRANQIYR